MPVYYLGVFFAEKPSFVDVFGTKTVIEGEKISLKCNVRGSPLPIVAWSQNEITLKNSITHQKASQLIVSSSFTVESATFHENGTYECIAQNRHGIIKHKASVTVYGEFYCLLLPKQGALKFLLERDLSLDIRP